MDQLEMEFRGNAPAERIAVSSGGPEAGVATAGKRANGYEVESHPLPGAKVRDFHHIMLEAFRGYPARLQDLYDDILDRDPRVGGPARARVQAVQARPWSVRPPDHAKDDEQAAELAERVSRVIGGIRAADELGVRGGGGWRTCVGDLADGSLKGFAVSEVEWGRNAEGLVVPLRLHWRHQNRFLFHDGSVRIRETAYDRQGRPLNDYGRDKFVVHSPTGGRSAYIVRRGALLGCLFPALTKRYGQRWWMKAAERWGQPLPIAKLRNNDKQLIREVKDVMRNMHANWNGVLWGDVEIDALGGGESVNHEVFERIISLANTEFAIQLLGQNLTTEVTGGSYAATAKHGDVKDELRNADCAELDGTITHQLVEPIVRYNWPELRHIAPVYETNCAKQHDVTLEDVKEGVYSPDEYRARKGDGPMPEGAGKDYREPLTVQAVTLTMPGAPASTQLSNATEQPPGGADAAFPFGRTRSRTTPPTSSPYERTSASALYRSLAGSGRTSSRPS